MSKMLSNILERFGYYKREEAIPSLEVSYEWEKDAYFVNLGIEIDHNKQGKSGEDYFSALFSQCNMTIEFLGDKAPDVDCFVQFKDKKIVYEFLVQVKSTSSLNDAKCTVNSGLTKEEYSNLQSYHMPTYLARVDMKSFNVYIKGAFLPKNKANYSSVSKQYVLSINKLDDTKRIVNGIATEVKRYWDKGMGAKYKEQFKSYFSNGKKR